MLMAAGLGTEQNRLIRFDVLPDEVLLDVFDFYTIDTSGLRYDKKAVEAWQTLVHVCRRWRILVFGSPRRLNLRLYCAPETRTRDTLDVWPALPIIIHGKMTPTSGTHNIIAALEQSNRVCGVTLDDLSDWQLEQVVVAMEVPFPKLTVLELSSCGEIPPVIPDSFLGGSAPHLLDFVLDGIRFPGLTNLLLSATHLVRLWLIDIPHPGYISPEAMVALLSTLSSLEEFCLEFETPEPYPDWEISRLPLKRSTLPALKYLRFGGVTEYLEDFVTLIDTPQLDSLRVVLDNIDFDIQRLAQFVNRTPKLSELNKAHVEFDTWTARVLLGTLELFTCGTPDLLLSSVALFASGFRGGEPLH